MKTKAGPRSSVTWSWKTSQHGSSDGWEPEPKASERNCKPLHRLHRAEKDATLFFYDNQARFVRVLSNCSLDSHNSIFFTCISMYLCPYTLQKRRLHRHVGMWPLSVIFLAKSCHEKGDHPAARHLRLRAKPCS